MNLGRLDGLVRSALSLMMTIGLTSVLGLVFWIVAARQYTPEVVGRSSTEIAAATLVATLAALNINAVLTRLLPTTGVRTRWFVARAYIVTCALAVAIGAVLMLLGVGSSFLGDSISERIVFVLMGVLLLAFTLQDGVLTGLRKAPVILFENSVFAVVKLGALIGLAALLPISGIVVAWMVPVVIAVVVVTAYLFMVVIPEHERAADGASDVPGRRKLYSFISAEYSKAILSTGTTWLLPLLVTAHLGSVEEAYFYIPWLINYSATMLPYGISAAYVVESAFEGQQSYAAMRRSIQVGGLVVIACTLAEFFVVPLVLHLAGPGYAENGTTLVRILALTLPFNALNALYGTFAWMEQKLWRLVVLQASNAAILLGGSLLLMDDLGIEAVGWSYLVAQMVIGLGSIPPIVRRLRAAKERGAISVHGVAGVVPEPDGLGMDLVDAVVDGEPEAPDGRALARDRDQG